MPAITDISHLDLWFRVYHEEFSPDKCYKPLAYISFGETAWAQLLFVNERGMPYSVMVYKTRCVNPEEAGFVRDATPEEAKLEQPKAKGRNSCIEELDR